MAHGDQSNFDAAQGVGSWGRSPRRRRDCHFWRVPKTCPMHTRLVPALVLALGATAAAQTPSQDPYAGAANRMLEHIRVLASDEFEGRAPGTAGEEKTDAYLTQEYGKLGLTPGNPDGTFIQRVPMVGIVSATTASFEVGATTLNPAALNDYVAVSRHVAQKVAVRASDVVFVGYGVVAPEYGWDDFKGLDVRGKTIIVLINDPPVPDPKDPTKLDDAMFKGKAMTYYGRWMYKFEEATIKGAAACLIVHETGPAGYPFAVVQGSFGRENFSLETPDGDASRPSVEGWLSLAYAKTLFAAAGYDFETLKAAAARPDFHPVDFKATASFSVANTLRPLTSRNVVARLEGTDPSLRDEVVVYSAHWDHLGRNPKLKGDQIFNGAADNASGSAAILEIAREFTALPQAERPRRSVLFLSVTAEEQGLLGSEFYAKNPLYPLTKTLADINIDGIQRAGRSRDLEGIGLGNSTLDDLAASILKTEGRVLVPDADPEKGYFYRSDHFEFAKVGVPAFYTGSGLEIIGQPDGYGRQRRDEYITTDYHKVSDEIKPWWDLRGGAQDADVLFQMGLQLARGGAWPQWKDGCEFKARRDAMMAAPSR
jgi:Zn-dependent M28 family amino/carboxypeptidase